MLTWLVKRAVTPPLDGFDAARAVMDFSECAHTGQKMSFLRALYQADQEGLLAPMHKAQLKPLLLDGPSCDGRSYDMLVDSVCEGLLHPDASVHATARDVARLGFDKSPLVFASLCAAVSVNLTDPDKTKRAQRAVLSLFDVEASWGRREFVSLDCANHVLSHQLADGAGGDKALALHAVVGLMPSTAEFNPLMWRVVPRCLTSNDSAVRAAAASAIPFLVQEDRARAKTLRLKELAAGVEMPHVQNQPATESPARALAALSPRLEHAKDWLNGAVQQVDFVRRHPVRTVVGFMSPF